MRDTSIFQGIKELTSKERGESFRFEERYFDVNPKPFIVWNVLRKQSDAYVLCGQIEAHPRTSNKALFEEAYQRFAN